MKIRRLTIAIISLCISFLIMVCLLLANSFNHTVFLTTYFKNNQATVTLNNNEHQKLIKNKIKTVDAKVNDVSYWLFINYQSYDGEKFFYNIKPTGYTSISDGVKDVSIILYKENGFAYLFAK